MSVAAGADDRAELAAYVEVWWQAVNDFLDLLEQVPDEEWTTPTDLAGWDVRACAAHTAHLEGILAGNPEETAEVGEPAHVTGFMGLYTEIGVVNRRDASADAIINEIREVVTKRHTALLADPPTDGDARPQAIFGGVPWTWRTLLRNRPLDVWMHEQDVRRAVARPGGYDSPVAEHVLSTFGRALPMVVGKRVAAPRGAALRLAVPEAGLCWTVGVGEDGRAALLGDETTPTASVTLCPQDFVVLAGGRRAPESTEPLIEGDEELGHRLLHSLTVTP
jgi:uncharacterized protein (TIGR03083 family)